MVGRSLTMAQKAAAVVASYPVFPDVLAVTTLLAQEHEAQQRGGGSSSGGPREQTWRQAEASGGDSTGSDSSRRWCY